MNLPESIYILIIEKIEKRYSNTDNNFMYIHQEDVIDIAKVAYNLGIEKGKQINFFDEGK